MILYNTKVTIWQGYNTYEIRYTLTHQEDIFTTRCLKRHWKTAGKHTRTRLTA